MISVLRIFWGAKGTKPLFVLFCLLLAGLAEGLGMSTLLPAITQVAGGTQENSSALNNQISGALNLIGLTPSLGVLMSIVVIALGFKAILSFGALSYVGYTVAEVATGLRTTLLTQLMGARWTYFSEQRVGRIANVISVDATRAGTAYFATAQFVTYLLQSLVYVVVAFLISWKLALAGILVSSVLALILNVFLRISRRAGFKQTDQTSQLVTLVSDALNNIKPIKTMARQGPFLATFAHKIKKLRRALRRQVIAKQGRQYGQELLMVLTLGAGVYLSSAVWKIPLPELLVMGIVMFQVISIIGKLQKALQKVYELESAYWRVHDMIDDTARNIEDQGGSHPPSLTRACVFENVSFSHDQTPIIQNASFQVQARQITVLRGPSGAGKTTLIDMLIGLHRPASGSVLLDDVPLQDINLDQWRKRIGYVPQELSLFHDSIRENITLGDSQYTDVDVIEALEHAGALAIVEALPEGLDTIVGEHGTKLSGGQRQRLAIARALVTKPDLLILDEVTSALDPETETEICNNIAKLKVDYTIIAITHRDAWTRIADRLYQVENGNVTEVNRAAA